MSNQREALAGRVACITFADAPLLAAFERGLGLDVPLFGDAVFDASGVLTWIHRSAGPEDRPSVATVATELRAAAGRR